MAERLFILLIVLAPCIALLGFLLARLVNAIDARADSKATGGLRRPGRHAE
jgi:hypothetical protein